MPCEYITKQFIYAQKSITRRKSSKKNVRSSNDLAKCLTTIDLTNLGIGSILGAGIYVVSGQVAINTTGPAVVLSFTIAAFASLLSGLCYAEFGSRVPNTTGSAYAYSYHTVGELIAFIIGWNLILEYMIGTAADARALSSSIDYLLDRRLSNFSRDTFSEIPVLETHPDLLALFLTMLVTIILAAGVKESVRYSAFFNVLNGGVALLVIALGAWKAQPRLWTPASNFFPTGANGVLSGAASCFYAFVGFDIIATTGEEARSPSQSIPRAIALSLFICCLLYLGVSAVLTLMIPFGSMQNSDMPLIEAFEMTGLYWTKYVVGCGAIFGLAAALLGSEFPLPRIIYAMATDGLIFKIFRYVSPLTATPLLATLVPGFMTAVFAALFNLQELVEMMSIGTLLAYSLVCTSVLLLRYQPINVHHDEPEEDITSGRQVSLETEFAEADHNNSKPTPRSINLVHWMTVAVWLFSGLFSILFIIDESVFSSNKILIIVLACLFVGAIIICWVIIRRQPQDNIGLQNLHFKVPLVPAIPILAIFVNVFLMMRLSGVTWLRFAFWMAIGLAIYIFYGMRNSEEGTRRRHLNNFSTDVDEMEPLVQSSASLLAQCNDEQTDMSKMLEKQLRFLEVQ